MINLVDMHLPRRRRGVGVIEAAWYLGVGVMAAHLCDRAVMTRGAASCGSGMNMTAAYGCDICCLA